MIDFDLYKMHVRYYLDCLVDLCHGGFFGGTQKTRYGHLGAHDTASSFYFVLSRLFGKYPVKESDVLVDVGCGKGRVISWWLRKGYKNRIIGIELDEIVAERTRKTFRNFRNVEILCGNAVESIPEGGTLFYLYNPFNAAVMNEFKEQLKNACVRSDEVRIYYVNCEFLDVFRGDGYWSIRTNYEAVRHDPEWPVRELDIGIPYPVAIIGPEAQRTTAG